MRIEKLYLKAFGPFTEREIDFGTSGASVHLVYGPNEAGKSSLLRAVHALLYGIPERTSDNFLHKNTALRIAAVLTDALDKRHAVIRRKGRVRSLLAWSGSTGAGCEGDALADRLIADLMGGIDGEQFSRMFGIGREGLIEGGKAILEGHGDVGESLFEAGAGLVGLRRLRGEFDAEADKLFKPRASTPLINATVAEYDGLRRQVRDATVRTEAWAQLQEKFQFAEAALASNRGTISARRSERERLERIRNNLPVIARREECLTELAGLAAVPDLPENFAPRRAAALVARDNAKRQLGEAKGRVEAIEADIAGIQVPEGFVERQAQIEAMHQQVDTVQQAQLDIPVLEAREAAGLDEARRKLAEIGFTGDVAGAERLRPKRGEQVKLSALVREHANLDGKAVELRRDEAEKRADLDIAEQTLAGTPPPQDTGPMEEAIRAASAHAESDDRLAALQRDADQRTKDLERASRKLGTWTATELRELVAPAASTLERLHAEREAIEAARRELESRIARTEVDLAVQEAEKERLEESGPVPSEEELAKAREHRDTGWSLVRQAYLERTADPVVLAAGYGAGADLPEAYETAIEHADDVADGLRSDTQRMTEHANAVKRIAEMGAALKGDKATLEKIMSRAGRWDEEWSRLTGALGVTVPSVRELQEWLSGRERVVADLGEWERRMGELDDLRRDLEAARAGLECLLPVDSVPISFAALLAAANRAFKAMRDAAHLHAERSKAVQRLKQELQRLQKRIETVNEDLTQWRKRWIEAVKGLSLGEDAVPEDVNTRLSILTELFEAIDEAVRVRRELDEKRALVDRYTQESSHLADSLRVAKAGMAPGDLVAEMFATCQKAVRDSQRRAQLEATLEIERRHLETAERDGHESEDEVRRLCDEARVKDEFALPAVEASAARKRVLSDEQVRIERELVKQNAARLDQVLEEAAPVDRDALGGQIEALDEDIVELEQKRDELAQALQRARTERDAVDGSSRAAEAAQQAQELLTKLKRASADYARLKASSLAIGHAVESYREKHQGPILKRAGEYFAMLTRGSFLGLDVDVGDNDRQVLVGRRGEDRVRVEGMSEGTADQLYLALRLAAIERHLENGPAVPVIVDDILVQFDDERAGAAFEALAILASRTQVLVFTHHEHLITVAQSATPNGSVGIYRLMLCDERNLHPATD